MSEIFTNILTKIGQQKKALAEASGTALNITTFKVGDGNGVYYEPTENQTALVNTKYTGTFVAGTQSQIVINPAAANEVLYKCFIPADIGGFTIRELGLFDADNNLILICKLPAQDKFALASGLYQPLTFTPKIIYTNPQTQAVLTPTSQVVPTTSEVINLIFENVPETICTLPMKNTDGTISLEFDTTLKLLSNKLSVDLSKIIKTDGTNKATSLLGYAAVVSASADLDIPSFKNVKDYITGLNYLKKDGTVTATSLLSYASTVTASADLNIPSYKNVKDYIAGLNYLKKDGTVTATSLLSYAAVVSASADLDIPSFKNVKDYFTANLPTLLPCFAVNAANTGTDGQPNYLSGVGTTTLTLNAGGSYASVVVTFANGVQKTISSNLTASMGTSTGTFFVALNSSTSVALTIFNTTELYIQPVAPTLAAYRRWLDTSIKPFVFKRGNSAGTAWENETTTPADATVPIALVTLTSGTINAITHLPLNHNFVDEFNNDSIPFGTVSTGSIYLRPNMKHTVTFSGASTVVIPEVPIGQEINIELDIKMSSAVAITWSKSIDWANAFAPPLIDTTQTYEIILTLKAGQTIWEGRWSPKTR